MDPVAHTLFGATLAQAGLKKRTGLGTATLVIGANLPDVDILSYAWSPVHALWFRRGVTHGALAMVVLPLILTAGILAWDRLVRQRWWPGSTSATGSAVAALAAISVLSHPLLDSLNVYGMRWGVPFSAKWIYGDTLFIVDPWLWAILTAGIFISVKRERRRAPMFGGAATTALLILGTYITTMGISTMVGRQLARRAAEDQLGVSPKRIMVAPRAVTPFSRYVVMDLGERYRFGTLYWFRRPRVRFDSLALERFPSHYAATAATRGPAVRKFLSWARFPYYEIEEAGDAYLVRIGDARYTLDPEGSWASIEVEVGR